MLSMLGLASFAAISGGTALAAPTAHHAAHAAVTVGPVRGKHRLPRPDMVGGIPGANFSSTNWDGYVATNLSNSNTATFNHVEAQWTEPAITCGPNDSTEVAFWVGLDGWGNSTVEQGGTEADCQGGTAHYTAWYEMYPQEPDTLSAFTVSPGDTIKSSVTYDTSAGEFDILVQDLTSGQSVNDEEACNPASACARSTAEVISEDPIITNDADTLPDYGTITYNDISITDVTGHSGTMSDPAWQSNDVTEISSYGVTKQSNSALSSDGSSFSTTWQAASGCNGQPQVAAEYQTYNTSSTTNQISPNIELEDTGCSTIPLSSLTVRYWFTEDGTAPMAYSCDYAILGCSNVSGTIVAVTPVTGADHYLQLSFGSGAGTIGPNGNTGIIQGRLYQTSFANMTQTNDYSFNANDTSFTVNPAITVYYNGTLIGGIEP
jgi:hypothetical protein